MNLLELRKKAGLTQRQAADFLQVSLRSYQSYETDESKQEGYKYQYMCDKLEGLAKLDETHGVLGLDEIKAACEEVLPGYGASYCYLFGSYARGEAGPQSDVDLLVSVDAKGLKFFGLVEELRTRLGKKLDLLTVEQLVGNRELLDALLKEGVKLYG